MAGCFAHVAAKIDDKDSLGDKSTILQRPVARASGAKVVAEGRAVVRKKDELKALSCHCDPSATGDAELVTNASLAKKKLTPGYCRGGS